MREHRSSQWSATGAAFRRLAELQEEFGAASQDRRSDALAVDEPELVGRGAHVVANLPYNIGTALLLKWLGGDWPPWWRSLTLMFQKEVAERIVARPDTDAYGRLSVAAQWRSQPRIAMSLNRSAFVPPPKVTSAVVHIVPITLPQGVNPEVMRAADRGRVRAAAQDAAIEPEILSRRDGSCRSARNRPAAPR